jgi:cardiolipin synthase
MESAAFQWITKGNQAVAEMVSAIGRARDSVRLEMYIFSPSPAATAIRQALIDACRRGVRVFVMIDAWGSSSLPSGFWDGMRLAGGQFRWFNPIALHQLAFRDHRKMLVCDELEAFVGGFNVGAEYSGDGVRQGWRDVGLALRGPAAKALAVAFDEMFARADFSLPPFARLLKSERRKEILFPGGSLLLSSPSLNNPLKKALRNDFLSASRIQIMSAYFLPSWALRRALSRAARRGAQVQVILPAKSDVPLSSLAARSLYSRLLQAGIEIFEYQPQILHAKLVVVDDIVYVGSSNLDSRSLSINYELMVRLQSVELASQARAIFQGDIPLCRQIKRESWSSARNLWQRFKGRLAFFILARLDPSIARRQWRGILARLKPLRRLKRFKKRQQG